MDSRAWDTVMGNVKIHAEVILNQISGIIVGWLIVYFIFPYIGIETNAYNTTASSIIFFIASYIRMYLIRIIFENNNKYKQFKKL